MCLIIVHLFCASGPLTSVQSPNNISSLTVFTPVSEGVKNRLSFLNFCWSYQIHAVKNPQYVLDSSTNRYKTGSQPFSFKKMNVFGNVFGFLFVFGSRSDSNVCVRKAALKSARSGLGMLLKHVMEGRGRIAAIHKVGVSCPFPTSCLVNLVTEAQETRYNFSASKFNRK